MGLDDSVDQLRDHGIALLRNVFALDSLLVLKDAAHRCFEAIASGRMMPDRFPFNPYSHSFLVDALVDFGCTGKDVAEPLAAPGLGELFSEALGPNWACKREQSWVRKKFTVPRAPSRRYHQQGWHQDGALGVHFPPEPGAVIPMTEVVTCWIPLDACGKDRPGLELVRGKQPQLLHFTQLDDAALRKRFEPESFWAPELEFGDGLVFVNSILHRTYVRPEMPEDRLSVEYRIFPARQ